MTYRFQSKAAGDVLMLEPAGELVLSVMGLKATAQGIIQPDAMPAAIRAVEAAIARDESQRPADHSADTVPAFAEEVEAVSLRRRAWPLLEMLKRAYAADEAIVWGV